jgi:hypothetical protein
MIYPANDTLVILSLCELFGIESRPLFGTIASRWRVSFQVTDLVATNRRPPESS